MLTREVPFGKLSIKAYFPKAFYKHVNYLLLIIGLLWVPTTFLKKLTAMEQLITTKSYIVIFMKSGMSCNMSESNSPQFPFVWPWRILFSGSHTT